MDDAAARVRFRVLFERYQGHVVAYVRRRAAPDVVEDVVADTFLVAWRSLEGLGADPLPWLYAVARRTLANSLRAQRRQAAPGARLAAQQASVADEIPVLVEVSEPVRSALLGLGEREREAVLLVAWEELSPREAAVAAGCSGVAFRARLYRARRELADKLGRGAVVQPRASVSEERVGP